MTTNAETIIPDAPVVEVETIEATKDENPAEVESQAESEAEQEHEEEKVPKGVQKRIDAMIEAGKVAETVTDILWKSGI